MRGRKRIDETHPDFQKYFKKYKAIWDAYYELEERERAKYPDWKGMDHPANDVLLPAHRKCCQEAKALQEEYSYLFTDD